MRAQKSGDPIQRSLLILLTFLLVGSSTSLAESPGPGLPTGAYVIEEVGVLIEEKTAKGKAWDRPASPPDPAIEVRVNGKTIAECKEQDSFEVRCEFEERIQIRKITEIRLIVVDADIASDDSIGQARLKGLTNTGQLDTKLAMEVEGQLTAAHIKLRKAPNLVHAYRSRLMGLAIGIGLGLLLLFGFKEYWFRERPAKAVKNEEVS